jgi:hypothetical protein
MRTTHVARSIQILAAALVAAAAAPAYAQTDEVIATVPFNFVVGTEHLPAGKYIVRPASEDLSVVLIESADGRGSAFALTIANGGPNITAPAAPGLTFEIRGAEHVLAGVVEGDGSERNIVRVHSSRERERVAPAEPER